MADIGSALMHIGGGMARGFGAGMQEDILELRRQAHAELERGFRREEREASQTFQAGQNELGRTHQETLQRDRLDAEDNRHRLDREERQEARDERAPTTREVKIGEDLVTQEWDRASRSWRDVGRTSTKGERMTAAQAEEAARKYARVESENEYGRKTSALNEEKYHRRLGELGYPNIAARPVTPPPPPPEKPEPDKPPRAAGAGDGKRRPFFSSAAAVQRAIQDGRLKPGDEFVDGDGNIRMVPQRSIGMAP
ncbi:MAG: hypothetical protein FJX60_17750 [Alphaproteobacteria bacterium]|nr:hypothetical protein [Alphaproteobacteria bacterium]